MIFPLRRLFKIALVALPPSLLWLGLSGALAATLKPEIKVEGSAITLGDLFDDAGSAADVIVAAAPVPGQKIRLVSSRVEALARQNGLMWQRTTLQNHILVLRTGQVVRESELLEILAAAVREEGLAQTFNLRLFGNVRSLTIPVEAFVGDVIVEQISLDSRTKRFRALLRLPADDGRFRQVEIGGQLLKTTSIPVLRRSVGAGEIIRKGDIQWIELPTSRSSQNYVESAAEIIGQQARRPIRSGQPIRRIELQRPVLIKKGRLVTMVVKHKNMILTATGKALEDGGMGDVIRLSNTKSRLTLEGKVVSPERVDVIVRSRIASSH